MIWNPTKARSLLGKSHLLTFIAERDKLSAFQFSSGRELALNEENTSKVSIYLSRVPYHMPMVTPDGIYEPNADRRGRHSNLQFITKTLGFNHKIYKVHVESEAALEHLIGWYQFA